MFGATINIGVSQSFAMEIMQIELYDSQTDLVFNVVHCLLSHILLPAWFIRLTENLMTPQTEKKKNPWNIHNSPSI